MPASPAIKKMRILPLIAVIFFTVSGGPYGLEPLLRYAGSHGVFLLLLVTPLLWDVPAIFTVLELNSMMPVEGGYYKWVKHALGTRWGFFEGWWTWLYTFCDLAIYPVYIVTYATFFFPGIETYKIEICLVIIWVSAGLNILGINPVGRISLLLSVVVLLPLLALLILFFYHHAGHIGLPSPSLKGIAFPSLGMAMYIVMWNCLGWDNVTTYAGEVNKPVRSYIISIFTAFALVIIIYFLMMLAAQQSHIDFKVLEDDGFPALGSLIGGRWLGVIVAIGGMASYLGIYATVLLSVSRVPKVMSDDKLLPQWFSKLHPTFNTPYISIITCSLVVSAMVLWKFEELIIIDVIVYGAGLFLEYISLIALRIKEPEKFRPFKIRLNIKTLSLLTLLPLGVYAIALSGALMSDDGGAKPAIFAIGLLVTAEIAWQLIRWRKKKLKKADQSIHSNLV
ncbi:MAG TPA: APC family permease [Mucilaginibacter sp.]|nr:APC family permease [Mucilaginibacter sp.]